MVFLTKKFWADAVERSIKTVAQTLISLWGIDALPLDLLNIDWTAALSVAGGAALLSVLMSIVSANVGDNNTASLVQEIKYKKG